MTEVLQAISSKQLVPTLRTQYMRTGTCRLLVHSYQTDTV